MQAQCRQNETDDRSTQPRENAEGGTISGPVHSPTGGRLTQQIASAAVRGHKRFLGRGPTKAQAFFRGNVIVVLMEETLTEAERRLAASGARDEVLRMRQRCQQTMGPLLIDAIQELTGCRVEAFMSGSHIEPDLAAELFVLDRPVPGDPAPPDGPT